MIIDLAIVDDDVAARLRMHRLVAGRRDVDDGEPVVGEADATARVEPDAAVVGTAIAYAPRHPREGLTRPRVGGPPPANETRYPAHALALADLLQVRKCGNITKFSIGKPLAGVARAAIQLKEVPR